MRRWRAGVVVMGLAVGVAGCGGSSKSSAPTTLASTTTTRPTAEADKARAAQALLVALDLPGYTESTPDDTPDPSEAALDACLGNDPILAGDKTNPRYASGKEFEKGPVFVSSDAVLGETEDQARTAMNRFRAPEVPACITKAFGTVKVSGATLRNVTVTPVTSAPVGDEAVVQRVSGSITSKGVTAKLAVDLMAVRKQRGVGLLTFGSVGQPFPDAERTALAQKVVDRLVP